MSSDSLNNTNVSSERERGRNNQNDSTGNQIRNIQLNSFRLVPNSSTSENIPGSNSTVPYPLEAINISNAALNHPAVRAAISREIRRAENLSRRSSPNTANSHNTSQHQTRTNNDSQNTNSNETNNGNPNNNPQQSQPNSQQRSTPTIRIHAVNSSSNGQNAQPRLHQQSFTNFNFSFTNFPELPPLTPEPVPQNQQANQSNRDNQRMEQRTNPMFDCGICFDVLDDPTNCSNCKTRFCYECLERVLNSSKLVVDGKKKSKCPTCRNLYTKDDMTRDEVFKKFMEKESCVECSHHGCNQSIPLIQLKKHEKECPHMVMKCKYAPFGCKWTGPRMHVEHHHNTDCHYEKVQGLVHQHRLKSMENNLIISHIQNQLMASTRHLQTQHNSMTNAYMKDIDNIFHIIQLVYTCTCLPISFFLSVPIWKEMFNTKKAKATVCNVLYFLPFVLLCIRKLFTCSSLFIQLLPEFASLSIDEKLHDSIDNMLISAIVFLCGFLAMMLYLSEPSDSTCWVTLQNSQYNWLPPVKYVPGRDIIGILLALIVNYSLDMEQSIVQSCILSAVLCTTVYFPSLIGKILNKISNDGSDGNDNNRAISVVMFGLRYGILSTFRGFFQMFDGLILSKAIAYMCNIPSEITMEKTDCILSSKWMYMIFPSLRLLFLSHELFLNIHKLPYRRILISSLDFIECTLWTLVIIYLMNTWLFVMTNFGANMGDFIANRAVVGVTDERQRARIGQPRRSRLIIKGYLAFIVWVLLLIAIVNTN